MAKPTEIVPAAVVDVAINIEAVGAELDGLLGQIRKGEAAIETAGKIMTDWRYRAGVLLAQVRKQFPKTGKNAKGWGEFVAARGISLDSAARYIEIAEQVKANPELAQGGAGFMDLYKTLGIAASGFDQQDISRSAAGNTPTAAPKQDTPKKAKPEGGRPALTPSKPSARVVPDMEKRPGDLQCTRCYDTICAGGVPFWHCSSCGGHQGMDREECANCHEGQRPAQPDSETAQRKGRPSLGLSPDVAAMLADKPTKPPAPDLSEVNQHLAEEGEEFNLAVERDRAYARFVTMFGEWPKQHHHYLIEAFDKAKEESRA